MDMILLGQINHRIHSVVRMSKSRVYRDGDFLTVSPMSRYSGRERFGLRGEAPAVFLADWRDLVLAGRGALSVL